MPDETTGEMSWKDAIRQVLREQGEAMHYKEIADDIADRGLRRSLGATPADTVNAMMSVDIQQNPRRSEFVRVERGTYTLRELVEEQQEPTPTPPPAGETVGPVVEQMTGIINAFGMFWRRAAVQWTTAPKLLGRQKRQADTVDFCEQHGVYLLHDSDRTVYIGRTTDQGLGQRLYQHTNDRLEGRWNRWSWFGVLAVSEEGELYQPDWSQVGSDLILTTMEALLIEALEPPQNRRRGDDLRAVEYLQVEDADIKLQKVQPLIEYLKDTLLE